MDFYDNKKGNFNNLKPVFDFIKQHKKSKAKTNKYLFYIDLIYDFLNCEKCIKNYCAKDFFDSDLFKFTDTNSYNELFEKNFERIVDILRVYLEKDKNNKEQIIEAMYNILEFAPSKFWYKVPIFKLLKSLNDNSTFNMTKINKIIERLVTLDEYKFPFAITILSYCEKNSVSRDIFTKAINHWVKNKKDLFKSFSLKIPKNKLKELNEQGKNIAEIENKYNKYIFTPSLINFIKQKLEFGEGYDLKTVLKDNFGEDNVAEGNNCDVETILYRLFFEKYMLVPHEKEDVIKLFETTKMSLPPYGKSLATSFYFDFAKIWDVSTASSFFFEMRILALDIICERRKLNQHLTLEDLKIIALSRFRFGGLDTLHKGDGIVPFWQYELLFDNKIPNKIDNKYYFRWVLQIFQNHRGGMEKEHFIILLKRYKFNDQSDFNDFYLSMKNITVVNSYHSDVDTPGNKIKVESDVDILSALLDSCDDQTFQNNPTDPLFYIRETIFETKNHELIEKMNYKFNLHLGLAE